jgi:hypothetical protein
MKNFHSLSLASFALSSWTWTPASMNSICPCKIYFPPGFFFYLCLLLGSRAQKPCTCPCHLLVICPSQWTIRTVFSNRPPPAGIQFCRRSLFLPRFLFFFSFFLFVFLRYFLFIVLVFIVVTHWCLYLTFTTS